MSNHLVNGTQVTSANVHELPNNTYHRWAYRQTTSSDVRRIFTSDEWCSSDPPANTAETGVRFDNTQMSRQVTMLTMFKFIYFSVVIIILICTPYSLYACTHVCLCVRVYVCACLSVCLSVYLSDGLFVFLSVCPTLSASISVAYISLHLSLAIYLTSTLSFPPPPSFPPISLSLSFCLRHVSIFTTCNMWLCFVQD